MAQGFTNFNNINANTVDGLHASATYEDNKILALDANSAINPKNFLQQGNNIIPNLNEARLTLTSGTPVTTSDVTGAGTIYYTPFKGNRITLYSASQTIWRVYELSEISIAVPATTDTVYDIFVYDNAGTVTLEAVAWTDTTTRATDIAYQNGIAVKDGATNKKYVGSFQTTSVSGQTEDSVANRLLFNAYNRFYKPLNIVDTTDSWNYTTETWRVFNNGTTTNLVRFVDGIGDDIINIQVIGSSSNATPATSSVGIGVNSTSTNSAQIHGAISGSATSQQTAFYDGIGRVGANSIYPLEISQAAGTTTWYGDRGLTYYKSGLSGKFKC